MKVLLLGEYSGLHLNLADGLRELGLHPIIAANGDSFKKIQADIKFYNDIKLPWLIQKAYQRYIPLLYMPKLVGYDVVQLVNVFCFYGQLFPARIFHKFISKNNHKLFLLAAGDDAYFWTYGRERLRYGPFEDFLKFDKRSSEYYMQRTSAMKFNNWLLGKSRGIIPIAYEYEVSYRDSPKLMNTIPVPINAEKIRYTDNNPSNKITIFHGLNRYGAKGTRHVEAAFRIIDSKYSKYVNLVIDGKMPLPKYLAAMASANVVIDQMYSYSLGVNGLYAMAMGKVVIGGGEPEGLRSHNVDSSPVVNVSPNSKSLVDAIEYLLDNRSSISEIGFRSRQYVENVHNHVKIAECYVAAWSSR